MGNKKILVATEKPFAKAAVTEIEKIVKGAGYEFALLEKYGDASELIDAVSDADALIVRSDKVTADVIDAGKNLKIVVRAGAGYDNVDTAHAKTKDVVVMNTPGQNSNAVAELAIGMMILNARNGYNGKSGTELKGKSLGIHAYGNVGQNIARIAKGLGMTITAYDPFIEREQMEKDGVKVVDSVQELYKESQYISLNIPANDQTKKSIDSNLLSLMPAGATLVNTARKEVVCEESLLRAFEEREDFNYLSDIAPDCRDTIESQFEGRYFFTPKKMGAQTAEANINAGIAAATQINNYFESGDTTFQVNK